MKLAVLTPFTPQVLAPWIPAVLDPSAPKGVGGSALFDLVTTLIERGHEVHVITLQPGLEQPVSYRGEAASIHIIPRRLRGSSRTFWKLERQMMVAALKDINPEVVHSHWAYEYGLAALDYSPQKSLVTAHDLPFDIVKYDFNPYYLPQFFASHYIYQRALWLSAVSPVLARYMARFARPTARIEVVPNIAPTHRPKSQIAAQSLHNELQNPYIVTIGHWGRNKNISTALRAFRLLRERGHSNFGYVLLGGGLGKGEQAEAWALKRGLAENVVFLGIRPRDDVLYIVSGARVCLSASYTESFGMSLVEAMSVETPVIGGERSGGVPWVLGFGKRGCLTDISSPKAIADSLESILSNDEYANRIINNGLIAVSSEFSAATVASSYEAIYTSISRRVISRFTKSRSLLRGVE